ncbi:MAG: energy transducer TonB [Tannerellaceae bacterium]|jgi:protein TonB|nr:energy transducer TonB [Tannerellaceae bacterium]
MESKKSQNASLESSKLSNYLMGLIVGLAILFVGFEWSTADVKRAINTGIVDIMPEVDIMITRPDAPPPPPPPLPVQVTPEILEIVENNVAIDQQDMRSTEDDVHTVQVESYVQPAVAIKVEEASQEIFAVVEEMPQFPGGDAELFRFLRDNIQYPWPAISQGISGRVTVGFVVNSDGSIVDATVLRGVDPALDKEALRVVSSMPKWTPGKQRGKPVRVKYTVPVSFKLSY